MLKGILTSRWLPWSLLLVLGAFVLLSRREMDWQRISRQNAEAALDVTRSISTRHGEVYARIIAQKDVELAGALREAAGQRDLRPVAGVGISLESQGLDTTATHPIPPRTVVSGSGDPGGPEGTEVHPGERSLRDSLVVVGPPVEGVVGIELRDSTILWTARLKPSSIPLTLSLGCGERGPEAMVQGPIGVETEIVRGQIDPKICNPPGTKFWTGVKYGAGITAIIVALLHIL